MKKQENDRIEYDQVASSTRLNEVAARLAEAILGMDATHEYGTTGRETTGGIIMAGLARSLVSVEKELREAQKQASESAPQNKGVYIMGAPEIPTPVDKAA